MSESPEEFIYTFNFLKLIKFFSKNGVVTMAIVAVLSYRLNDLSNDIFNNGILPLINIDIKTENNKIIKFDEYAIKLYKTDIYIGKILISLIKTIIIIYVIYLIGYAIKLI